MDKIASAYREAKQARYELEGIAAYKPALDAARRAEAALLEAYLFVTSNPNPQEK